MKIPNTCYLTETMLQNFVNISWHSPPETLSSAPLHYRNGQRMWPVFSESTRRAAHAHIGQTSQRVADFLWHLEVGNFDQK